MSIKSFRGQIADLGIETIPLHTNDGSTGYRIVKLQLFAVSPAGTTSESLVKVFSTPQTTANNQVDFNDQTLIASAFLANSNNPAYNTESVVIFDNTVFNQDIYLTHNEEVSAANDIPVNYYIELEQIKLDLNENTVATLKDIRNIKGQ